MNHGIKNGETKKGSKMPKCLEVVFLYAIGATNKNYRTYSFTLDRLQKCPRRWKPVLDIKRVRQHLR